MSNLVEVYFEGSIRMSRGEIEDAGGDFTQATQNAIGHTGAVVERCQDENDCYTLEQHDEDVARGL